MFSRLFWHLKLRRARRVVWLPCSMKQPIMFTCRKRRFITAAHNLVLSLLHSICSSFIAAVADQRAYHMALTGHKAKTANRIVVVFTTINRLRAHTSMLQTSPQVMLMVLRGFRTSSTTSSPTQTFGTDSEGNNQYRIYCILRKNSITLDA